jgi:hypothetical protein
MPATYSFDGKILKFTDSKYFSADEIIGVFTTALSDPRFVSGMNLLVDVSKRKLSKTVKDIIDITDFLGRHRKRFGPRCAIVSPRPIPFGLASLLYGQASFNNLHLKAFTDTEKATEWIGDEN